MGWKGESRRHSLARKGIKTANKPMRSEGRINYSNPKSLFFGFWKANIENDYSDFDFDKAFKEGLKVVGFWSGQTSYSPEDIYELFTDTYELKSLDDAELDRWIYARDMTYLDVILEDEGLMHRDLEMAKLYLRLKNPPKNLQEKIYLMDELIHTTHVTGSIWTDEYHEEIDVGELRDEFDQWYSGVRMFR